MIAFLTRRPLRLPILLAVVMIVMVVVLAAGWVILSIRSALQQTRFSALYWTLLSVGTIFFLLILAGVVVYLVLSIKAINITRRQSNFIDAVTHELKSPIASLKLYLQTLSRRQVPEKQCQEFYQLMLEDVDRLDNLINHVLEAARLDNPSEQTTLVPLRLDVVIGSCAESVRTRYAMPKDALQLDMRPVRVRAAPIDLELIFRNLLDNAAKYGGNFPDEPPRVRVVVRPTDLGMAVIHVEDNGPGIPKKLRKKVFRRFIRLGPELERTQTGLGLGLHIVSTLVARLGGKVHIKDRVGGRGTLFEVILPAVSESAEQPDTDRQVDSESTVADEPTASSLSHSVNREP